MHCLLFIMISRVGGVVRCGVFGFFLLLHSLAGARDRRREKCGIRSGYDDRLFSHSPCTTCEGYHQGASVAGLLNVSVKLRAAHPPPHVQSAHEPRSLTSLLANTNHSLARKFAVPIVTAVDPRPRRAGGPDRVYKRGTRDQSYGIITIKQHYSISGAAE